MRVEIARYRGSRSGRELFADLASTMPPLAGVMHAAMVLDDAIIANMDEASLLKVLRPKIAGAENLDRQTRGLALDYFVLFSSATTVIGNPGQGAYVAANGFLEGLARQRFGGLSGTCRSWAGSPMPVCSLATAQRVTPLAHRAGAKGIKAAAALDLMSQALSLEGGPGATRSSRLPTSIGPRHVPICLS